MRHPSFRYAPLVAAVAFWCWGFPVAQAAHPSPEDWRDVNIYHLFIDRFYDGDPSNNNANPFEAANPSNSRRIHGGDFQGIQQKLDYLDALGVNAIWIGPIPLNVGGSAWHGYAAHDFYQLAPQWGTLADLSNLVAAAHTRGMYVILDIVCNHQGNRIDSADPAWPAYRAPPDGYVLRWRSTPTYPPPFNQLDHFHNNGAIGNWVDPEQIYGELSGLDDLRTETEYVRTNLYAIYRYWISVADVDGFRIDTVKHVEIGFWQSFNSGIRSFAASLGKTNFFQFGEVYDGSDYKCGYYTGTKAGGPFAMESVLDYPLYFRINSVFAWASGDTGQLESRYHAIPANYDPFAQMRLVTFLDNHDNPRFLSANYANNQSNRLQLALTFLYTARGIPCLYYGTEQAFNGGRDPNNREDMFDGLFEQGPSLGDNFNMTHPFFQYIARLNNFRRVYPSLRRGSHENLWNNPSGPGLFAYSRRLNGEEVYIVLNTASTSQTLTNRPTSYPAGTLLINLLNTNESLTVTSGQDGLPPVTVPSMSAKMFVAASLLQPLDPLVINQSPSHGATNVPLQTPLVLQFDQPMDTASVSTAFTLQPRTDGVFSWSPAADTVTFTPNGSGWAPLTRYVVRVETGAVTAASGLPLRGAFETFFHSTTPPPTDTVPPFVSITWPPPGMTHSGLLMISGIATDNASVVRVEVRLDNRDWAPATGTVAWSFALDTTLCLNGSHLLSARATDSSGNLSSTSSVAIRFFNVPGDYEARISPGNPSDVTDCEGLVWIKDQAYGFGRFGYVGGVAGFLNNAISGVCASVYALYQRERYSKLPDSFQYRFDCPPGIYEITILQSETYETSAGRRVFDIFIEDQPMVTNLDLFAVAGGMNIPLAFIFTNVVADAQLELRFVPRVDSARASGLRVRKLADVDSDGDGIPDWWLLAHFDHAEGRADDRSRAGDDADGDGCSNLHEFGAGTDPLDSTSFLALTGVSWIDGPTLLFDSVSGRLYRLEVASNLVHATDWYPASSNYMGTGGPMFINDTNEAARAVYRLRVMHPGEE